MSHITRRQSFRMELHAQKERHFPRGFRFQLHRLDNSIRADSRRHERFRRFPHRLMMRTVHAQNPLARNLGEQRAGCQRRFMHQFERPIELLMVQRTWHLLANVRDELTAKRDVCLLYTSDAADE